MHLSKPFRVDLLGYRHAHVTISMWDLTIGPRLAHFLSQWVPKKAKFACHMCPLYQRHVDIIFHNSFHPTIVIQSNCVICIILIHPFCLRYGERGSVSLCYVKISFVKFEGSQTISPIALIATYSLLPLY